MTPVSDDDAGPGRRTLLVLAALFVVPLLAAAAWYFAAPRLAPAPSVHGTLIEPARPLEPFAAPVNGGGRYTLEDLRGHWTLVHVLGADCDAVCRGRLHDTRQVRAALGEDRLRVARVATAARGRETPGLADVLDAHPRLTVLRAAADGPLAGQMPAGANSGTVFVVDPLGNLMLRFGPGVAADGMLDDLERLLRLSRIG